MIVLAEVIDGHRDPIFGLLIIDLIFEDPVGLRSYSWVAFVAVRGARHACFSREALAQLWAKRRAGCHPPPFPGPARYEQCEVKDGRDFSQAVQHTFRRPLVVTSSGRSVYAQAVRNIMAYGA